MRVSVFKRIRTGVVAFATGTVLIVGAAGGLATAAHADEAPLDQPSASAPATPPTQESAPVTPVASEAPAAPAAAAPAPDTSSAPADVAPAAPESAPADTVAAPQESSSVPDASAKVVASTLPAPPAAPKYHPTLWLVPGGPKSPWTPAQTLVDHVLTDTVSLDLFDNSSKLLCNTTYQVDFNKNSKITDKLIAGGILYGPDNPKEDLAYDAFSHGANPYKVFTTPACPPVPPTDVCKNIAGDQTTVPAGFVQDGENCKPVHAVCTASTVDDSVWSTEDGAPVTGYEGKDFSTPTPADKVNYFGRTLNVPFAGITGGSYTVKNTGGAIVAYDMEVWQTGTTGFATIVFEPYVNGLTGTGTSGDGTFHTYVINGSSLVWNSKIASGEGSQAQPVTLTRMQELIPAATLIRAGLGQGKNNAGSLSTVSSFTDPACGTTTFPKKPSLTADYKAQVLTCTEGTKNNLYLEGVAGGFWTAEYDFNGNGKIDAGESTPLADGAGYDGDQLAGYVNYRVFFTDSGSGVVTEDFNWFPQDPETLECTVPTTTPDKVTFTCDAYTIAGASLTDKPFTFTDPETGDTTVYSEYDSDKGGYFVNDTTTKDGVRTVQITFLPYEGVAAAPGEGDTYTLVDIEGRQYAQWTHTFTKCEPTPPTTTPTAPPTSHPVTPAGTGGANTGLNGSQPGTSTSFWTAGNTTIFGVGAFVLIIALFGAAVMMVRRRNRNNGEAGVEAQ